MKKMILTDDEQKQLQSMTKLVSDCDDIDALTELVEQCDMDIKKLKDFTYTFESDTLQRDIDYKIYCRESERTTALKRIAELNR